MKTLSEIRKELRNVSTAAGTLSQAIKSLHGLWKKHSEELQLLGFEKDVTLTQVRALWSDELKDSEGNFALYVNSPITTASREDANKSVNVYEKAVSSKGKVSFKPLRTRVLKAPTLWTPALILEGLAQSIRLDEAKKEAAEAQKYVDSIAEEDRYVQFAKGTDSEFNIVSTVYCTLKDYLYEADPKGVTAEGKEEAAA